MTFTLLLADPRDRAGSARAAALQAQVLQTSPGGKDVTVSFRPNRADDLFDSAKSAAHLAYRILFREGIVRSQLAVRFEAREAPQNVVGRSADLLFALAIMLQVYQESGYGSLRASSIPSIAATGVLEADGTVRAVDHLVPKLQAACREFDGTPTTVFFPAANAAEVDLPVLSQQHPILQLLPIGHLDEALEHLGIVLERVYLRNPFRGLEYFDYEHRAIFFGRDVEVREVVEQLLRREANGAPGVLVEGASGSGKSSFMRAGLLAALVNPSSQASSVQESLRRRPVRDSVRKAIWRVGHVSNTADEGQIAQSILEGWRALPEFAEKLPSTCASLAVLADERQKHWPSTQRFVWLIDQFEELFTLGFAGPVIEAVGRFLMRLRSEGVWTLVCIRADAVPLLKQHSTFREVFGSNEGEYYLETIGGTALDDVIGRPAEAAGLTFDLASSGQRLDRVLREELYATRENTLPLLQFTLQELYQRRSGNVLLFETYEQLGGLSGSVATTAETTLQTDLAESGRALPRLFRSLVSVDDEGRVSKRFAPLEEVASGTAQRQLLQRLVSARLCVTDQREGSAVVAFAHEALLRTWPRLQDWITQEGALLQARELLVAEARRWEQHGKKRDWLVTSPDRLASIRSVIEADIPLPNLARRFAEQSATRARRAIRVRQLAVLSIAALAVIAVVFGLFARHAGNVASAQRDTAIQAQRRSLTQTAAGYLREGDVPRALNIDADVLANRSDTRRYTADAVNVFQETRAADMQVLALTGHADWVQSGAFSPDGRHIVTASADNTARIWDTVSGEQLLVLVGHAGLVATAVFSSDGRRIVTASYDKTARIWDAVSGEQLVVLRGHTDNVESAAFSPDDRRIITASKDKTARVWDAASAQQLLVLSRHTEVVGSAAFSPDGRRIVTASDDKTARVWDAASGQQFLVLSGHAAAVLSAAFAPDGRRIVTGSQDNTARIWDASSGQQLLALSGHVGGVMSAAFSPDGRRIATASFDKTARLWDADSGQQLLVMSGHMDRLNSAAFSPDGRYVVTASFDKTARLWDTASVQQLLMLSGHTDNVLSAAFSPDGQHIVTASGDKTTRVWNADSGQQLLLLNGHAGDVIGAVFSPDGQRIVTASADKTARIWDVTSGRQLVVLNGHAGLVATAGFSPDGQHIVTASFDKTARIWDADTGQQLAVLRGHLEPVASAAFSPDGRHIVTASFDKTARVWDATSGQQILVLSGHTDNVNSAAFSLDGRRIATASDDRTARVWDATSGHQILVLSGHTGAAESAAFSPDGRHVVTASFDKTARVWDARVAGLDAQVTWEEAAQFDPLSSTERFQLGLPLPSDARRWPADPSKCDQAAGAPYDPLRRAPGVTLDEIVPETAVPACAEGKVSSNRTARSVYQHGRALFAKGDFSGARRDFEAALAAGHRAAGVDLGMLLSQPSAGMLDVPRTISQYERAWKDGVTIAAFELGSLYEHGVHKVGNEGSYVLAPNQAKAWFWYQKGAEAGESNALARFGENEDRAVLDAESPAGRRTHLLNAFRYYASAAERARLEAWPDAAWRDWRYHRASIARVLAREGMMEQVADLYNGVLKQYAPRPTAWQRFGSFLGTK